jgi:uncharacterized protein
MEGPWSLKDDGEMSKLWWDDGKGPAMKEQNKEEGMAVEGEITKDILERVHTIAMVGLSPSEDKPSNGVAKYLKRAGYRVIPVNPAYEEILGEKSYKSLSDIPDKVDVVDVFMRADKLLPVVEEAIKIKAGAVWLQLGIVNEEAKLLAEKNGVTFVMDRCMKMEHARFFKKEE